jgi:FMN phosphatase YigB (HAD superfamily)
MIHDRIVCFDFDGTLCHTHTKEDGQIIYKEKTGENWPHRGWWSKPESLDMNIFKIDLNEWVYRKYLETIVDPKNYVILATGRIELLRKEVETILSHHNLKFDKISLNWGGDTFNFKCRLFEQTIKNIKPREFIMYDDRTEHIEKFKQWAVGQSSDITIINVLNKEMTLIEN